MSTILGDPHPLLSARRPTAMADEDWEIYKAWWPSVLDEVLQEWCNVRVGSGAPVTETPGDLPSLHEGWVKNTQKRIDVVALTKSEVWIIELRHAASANAIGRLLMYRDLWAEDPIWVLPVKLYLVTNWEDQDVRRLAETLGIRYVVV